MAAEPTRIEAIFNDAVELTVPAERAAFLDRTCSDDAELRQRVDALLAAHDTVDVLQMPYSDRRLDAFPVVSERPGAKIGRYKLLEQIGEGGFGVVFMAEQETPVRRKVALKVLKPGMDSRQVLARFEAERQALAIMDHPNIARVFDAGATDAGRPYFVMELVRGIPITEYCDQNQVAARERLELFAHVCHAVQHAHQKGIIHRDIKPTNVLVMMHDTEPAVKVIDFGIAKALGQELTEKTLFTGFAQLIGTPLYMSPEQAGRSALDVDTRSDIYSLGVLLYELLTGTTPFDKERFKKAAQDEIRRIIREEEPPKPSTRLIASKESLASVSAQRHTEPAKLTKLVRGELDWIVMKALEKDRGRRYETATGLAADVQRYLQDEPVQACPPSASYRLRKLTRKYRVPLAVAAGFVALLSVASVMSTWQAVRATRAEHQVVHQRDQVEAAHANEIRLRQHAEAQEKKALAEAAKSEQVARFMKDMLSGAASRVARGRDTTILREILDRTAQRIGRDLKTQPDVEAELRITFGEVYRDLAEYEKAETMLRRALQLRRERLGNDRHVLVAEPMDVLSLVLRSQRRFEEAEALQRDVLAIHKNHYGDDHPLVAQSIDALGLILHRQSRNAEAEPLYCEALAIRRKVHGDESTQVALSLSNLATLLRVEGRLSESEPMHREALVIRRKLYGNDHPETAMSVNGLANLLRDQGKLEEAEPLYREALAIRRKIYGGQHPYVVQSLQNLGCGLLWQGRLAEADEALHEAVVMQRKLDGQQDAGAVKDEQELLKGDKAVWYRDWATEANRQGRFEVAETAARQALQLRPDDAIAHRTLGVALFEEGRIDEAIVSHSDAIRLAPNDAWSHYHLGNALLKKGQSDEAIAAYRQTLQLQPGHAPARKTLASAHAGKGLSADAILPHREQLRLARGIGAQQTVTAQQAEATANTQPDGSLESPQEERLSVPATLPVSSMIKTPAARITPASLDQLNREAYLLRRDNRLEEACALRARVVESAKTLYSSGDARLVKYQDDYVQLLIHMQRYEEAETVARQALESVSSQETFWRTKVLRSLVQLYEQSEKPDEAERYRKMLTSAESATQPSTIPAR